MRGSTSHHGRRLIEAYCHGEAGEAQLAELAAMLSDDAAIRRRFLEAMDLHAALRWKMTAELTDDDAVAPRPAPMPRSRWRIGAWVSVAAAIALIAGLIGVMMTPPTDTADSTTTARSTGASGSTGMAPVAVMMAAQDVKWRSNPIQAGQEFEAAGGPVAIESGTLEIALLDSTTMWITGPAEFTVISDTSVALHRGQLHARSQPGFTVELSPHLRLTDLGTEFGVVARDGEPDELWVSQGRVRVDECDASQRWVTLRTITAGQPANFDDLPVRVVSTMPSLIGLWRFDDADTLGDGFGRGHIHLTVHGDAGYTADGHTGGALTLDGNGDSLEAETFPEQVPTGNAPYTIAAWIAPTTPGRRGIIGWGEYGTANAVTAMRLTDDRDPQLLGGVQVYWWGNDQGAGPAQTHINLMQGWHHVAATWDGEHRQLWLDGQLVASDTPGAHAAVAALLTIGRTSLEYDEFFAGRLDDVAIFDAALNAAQIQAVMRGDFCAGSLGAGAGSSTLQPTE